MNRICFVCNKKIDEKNYLKNRIFCKSCYNKKRRKNTSSGKQKFQPKNDNNIDNNPNVSFENHRRVIIGPSNVGKT